MIENRPESFLRIIRRSQRGKLKIYLGYAAGVGKTYQMLLEGHRLREDGIDVAVGLVETHGRAETEALLEGLESIPRRRILYRGIEIAEMDLDAILKRRPSVALIDELAHTNVPGSKNDKRYQDVEEILSAGIHIISTLNVQHLESLYETVERSTGVKVRERIPDRIISEADQIVNVDITTEDLRRRLKEGKVYTPERIETALDHFFKSTNLEQLRELTLRELAAQIDSRRRDPLKEDVLSSPDQVLVCLSSKGPNSEALLRYASRLAGRLNRNWYAIYVQTSRESPTAIDTATQRTLANTLTLAQQLGATVFTYKGDDIVKTILQFAKEYRVGHIVIGATARKIPFWRRLKGEISIVERLITEGTDITVVVLDTMAIKKAPPAAEAARPSSESFEEIKEKEDPVSEREAIPSDRCILIWDEPIEKEEAIRQLLDACCREGADHRESAWEALLERERQGGTFMGEDVAIPHARITGLKKPFVALGVGTVGIRDRDTGRSARIMFLLLSPAGSQESHLALLGAISRMARDDQWRKEVLSARKPTEAMEVIREWEVRGAEIR
ncbi:MAG: PTS sugar transporter subunit IIA [Desulfobacteraceae bacterium]|nr:MAG: PTS sugar transporter subunit IIA [Desulfobacteraceae bacterium]